MARLKFWLIQKTVNGLCQGCATVARGQIVAWELKFYGPRKDPYFKVSFRFSKDISNLSWVASELSIRRPWHMQLWPMGQSCHFRLTRQCCMIAHPWFMPLKEIALCWNEKWTNTVYSRFLFYQRAFCGRNLGLRIFTLLPFFIVLNNLPLWSNFTLIAHCSQTSCSHGCSTILVGEPSIE